MPHKYTSEQVEFIKANYWGTSRKDLTARFNSHFGLDLGVNQITSWVKNHKIRNGLSGRFEPGQEAHNKGRKGIRVSPATEFKKGNRPWNYLPIGTERINGDDYVDIKIADPNKWKGKHTLVWEAAHGPVPRGQIVIFGDGNRRNFELSNLIMITRGQLARMNQNHLIKDDADLTRTGVLIADVITAISRRKKSIKKGGRQKRESDQVDQRI